MQRYLQIGRFLDCRASPNVYSQTDASAASCGMKSPRPLTTAFRRRQPRRVSRRDHRGARQFRVISHQGACRNRGHSQALVADGLHSLSDLLTDNLVLVAGRQAVQGPGSDHWINARTILVPRIMMTYYLSACQGVETLPEMPRGEKPSSSSNSAKR